MNIKKVIAREGLVIMSIIIAFFVVLSLINNLPYERPKYRFIVYCLGQEYERITDSRYSFIFTHNYIILRDLLEEYPQNFDEDSTRFIMQGYIPKDFEWKFDEQVHTPKGNTYLILETLMLLVIIAYPIHLIFRFIIWSVRTLRGKNE